VGDRGHCPDHNTAGTGASVCPALPIPLSTGQDKQGSHRTLSVCLLTDYVNTGLVTEPGNSSEAGSHDVVIYRNECPGWPPLPPRLSLSPLHSESPAPRPWHRPLIFYQP
jgi:hypothetical protein